MRLPSPHPVLVGRCRGGRSAAFTLIELLVALAIAAVLAAIGIPFLGDTLARNEVTAAANAVRAAAEFAQSEAFMRRGVVRWCRSVDAAAATPACTTGAADWSDGWVVWADANNNGAVDAGEAILGRQTAMNETGRVGPTVAATGSATGFNNGRWIGGVGQFCISRRAAGSAAAGRFPQCLTISTGQIPVLAQGVCPAGGPAC